MREFIENGGQLVFDTLYDRRIHHFEPEAEKKIIKIFEEMNSVYEKNKPYGEQILKGMLYGLFDTVWECSIYEDNEKFITPLTEPIINAVAIINELYHEDISLPCVSRQIGLSASYLSRLFKQEMGKTFSDYLTDVRLSNAKQLLIATDRTIMEIAGDVGFGNGDYLSACFKKKTGVSPLRFRKMKKLSET